MLADFATLIVEANAGMRTQLRAMLAECGINRVEFALTAGVAIRKLRDTRFDLVLCEYHLGEGQDGQHFLEDARHHQLLPLATVFIMVTGESAYEKVVSAAELAPNDYILKPFSIDKLRERLARAFQKREAFLPAYNLIEVGNLRAAIDYCSSAEIAHPQYRVDLLRLRAELHYTLGEPEEAQVLYQQIMDTRAVPWARLGLAKALLMQKKFDEAQELLHGLVDENALFMDAYDWLARAKEETGEAEEAFEIIQRAVYVSPHHTRRLRRLGQAAQRTGNLEVAERAFAEVVRKGKYSDFRDPEDHVHLVRTQLGRGSVSDAEATVRDLERSMAGLDKTKLCSALSAALVHTQAGDPDKATKALQLAMQDRDTLAGLSVDLKGTLARTLFSHQLTGEGTALVRDMMRDGDTRSVDAAAAVLQEAGHGHLAEEIQRQVGAETQALVADGVSRARNGDYQGAVDLMLEALARTPNNAQIQFNACVALLKYMENLGWNADYGATARAQIGRLLAAEPGNPRYMALNDYFHMLLKKYGIRRVA